MTGRVSREDLGGAGRVSGRSNAKSMGVWRKAWGGGGRVGGGFLPPQ